MALKPEDLERLRLSIEDLTRADRELFDATQRSQGVGAFGPAQLTGAQQAQLKGADVTSVAGAGQTPFWQQGGKFDDAAGHGLSAARTMLSAGGFGGIGSLVGGLAQGPMGLVEAAAGFGGQALQRELGAVRAGYDAYANAPVTDTDSMAKTRARYAQRQAQRDNDQWWAEHTAPFLFENGRDMREAQRGWAEMQRLDNAEKNKALAPEEMAMQRTMGRLQSFAEAGGLKTDGGMAVALEVYRMEHERTTNYIMGMDAFVKRRDQMMTPGAPGAQGRLGAK